MTEPASKGARLQISVIALVFFGPLIVATWMYSTGSLQPAVGTNHGTILEPIANLKELLPNSALPPRSVGPWRLLYVNSGECDVVCRDALLRLRQIRLMLGSEMDRVARVFLHGDPAPDKVFLKDQHAGLITISDKDLAELLQNHRPNGTSSGGIYLIDPLDNLIMFFSPDIDPGDMADDLKHLLDLSRIG